MHNVYNDPAGDCYWGVDRTNKYVYMMYNKVGIDGLTMISIVFKYHIKYAGITMIKYNPPKV